jgi:hypothetical protein
MGLLHNLASHGLRSNQSSFCTIRLAFCSYTINTHAGLRHKRYAANSSFLLSFEFRSTNRGSALESSVLGGLLVRPLHSASASLLLRPDVALSSLLGNTLR